MGDGIVYFDIALCANCNTKNGFETTQGMSLERRCVRCGEENMENVGKIKLRSDLIPPGFDSVLFVKRGMRYKTPQDMTKRIEPKSNPRAEARKRLEKYRNRQL